MRLAVLPSLGSSEELSTFKQNVKLTRIQARLSRSFAKGFFDDIGDSPAVRSQKKAQNRHSRLRIRKVGLDDDIQPGRRRTRFFAFGISCCCAVWL